jgi:ABC-type multidrug transport system permease subunit
VARDAESAAPGKLVYFGPAHPDAVRFFEPPKEQSAAGPEASPDGVLRGLARHPVEQWSRKYQESSYHRRFVAARAGRVPNDGDAAVAPPRNDDWLRQSATLIRRNLALKLADGWNTAILLAQAPIIALLIVLVFGRRAGQTPTADNWTSTNAATATTIFLLVLTAIWFGCSNAAREIVGEWAVYRRERMVHLRLSAYLTSKLVVGALLCSVQCAVLLATARLGCGLKGPIAATYLILMTAACTGIGIGLVISAIARTQEVAMGLLPLVLIPMVIFGGSLLPVHNMQRLIRPVANVMPTRHGFEALMLLEASRKPLGPSPYSNTILTDASVDDPDRPDIAEHYLPRNRRLGVTESTLALLFLFGAAVVSIVLILRYRDVH